MVNCRAGSVKLKESDTGLMAVARAYSKIRSVAEETLNVCRVMRSAIEGNGVLGPGDGSPGNGGAVDIISSEMR